MTENYFAGGFLFHAATREILLCFRGTDTPFNPNMWGFFGGWREEEDGGDPVATWCREMREELGMMIDPARVVSLRD